MKPFRTLIRKPADPLKSAFRSAIAHERDPRKAKRLARLRERLAKGTVTSTDALIAWLDISLGHSTDNRTCHKEIHGGSRK